MNLPIKHRNFLIVTMLALAIFSASCAKFRPPIIEYADACADINKGKTIAVPGFLNVTTKTPCLADLANSPIKRRCGFKFMDKVNITGKEIILYLQEGKENNQAETPAIGQQDNLQMKIYAGNEVKIHLADGTVIIPQENIATPVIVTGEAKLSEDSGQEKLCIMTASTVEKRTDN